MNILQLEIPENIELEKNDTVRFLAAKLYEAGKLSLGQAAELAKLSKVAFAEILSDYSVALINYPVSDIKKDASIL